MNALLALWTDLSAWRIGLWGLFWFVVLAACGEAYIPADVRRPNPTEILGAAPSDPRVVRREVGRADPREFLVAWVTDSSLTILKADRSSIEKFERAGFIADRIQELAPDTGGRPLRLAVYMQVFGPKAIDKYFESQHALSLKPDLFIYTVNPTFDFTSIHMMGEPLAPGALATFGTWRTYKWALLLSTPAELVQGGIGRVLPGVGRRFDQGAVVARWRSLLDPFRLRDAPPPPTQSAWPLLMLRGHLTGSLPNRENIPTSQWIHLLAMRHMTSGDPSWGKLILRDLVGDIRDAGIPSLIYMIPVNFKAVGADATAMKNYLEVERWFADFAHRNSDGLITIVPQTPSRFLEGLEFYDTSHLTQAEPFAKFIAAEIEKHAKRRP